MKKIFQTDYSGGWKTVFQIPQRHEKVHWHDGILLIKVVLT